MLFCYWTIFLTLFFQGLQVAFDQGKKLQTKIFLGYDKIYKHMQT